MRFDEKLMILRKKRGMSQEQLAERLGVTRQSVSKWESGQTLPELTKMITLSELFEVSVDYLVKDYLEEDINRKGDERDSSDGAGNTEFEKSVHEIQRYIRGYEFISKTKIAGIPLVCIRFSRSRKCKPAKGIIAIGNIAIGIISIGLLSVGVFSIGCLALGLLAFGALAAGGAVLGSAAIGILAIGPAALGIYAGGVVVYGVQIGAGVVAGGNTVIGETIKGVHELQYYKGISPDFIRHFLLEYHPKLWKPLLELFVLSGTYIK